MNERTRATIGIVLSVVLLVIALLVFTAPAKGLDPDDMPIGVDFPVR